QLLWWLLADLFTSAFQVAWESISYGPRTKAGIVAVPVPADTDHVVATAANLVSLGPGKFVLQIDREQRVFYVYALGMQGEEDAAKIRREVLEMQSWVVRAIGSDEDVRALDHLGPTEADQPAPPSAPPSAGARPTPPEEDR
ncbi:Na+/H+ antiporter subunit E, partial [Actinoalloteichus caeruleus]